MLKKNRLSGIIVAMIFMAATIALASCSDTAGGEKSKTGKQNSARKPTSDEDWFSHYDPQLDDSGKKIAEGMSAKDYIDIGRKALNKGDSELAVRALERAIKINPHSAEAYYLRGQALDASAFGDEEHAMQDMEKALELNCHEPDLYERLARIYAGRGKGEQAIETLNRGVAARPDEPRLLLTRAAIQVDMKNNQKALDDYAAYLKVRPKKWLAHYLRANLLAQMGRNDEALAEYDASLSFDRADARPLKAKAELLFKLGRKKEAIKALTELIDHDRFDDDDALRLRGNIFFEMKDYAKAEADYTRAIKMSPDYARAGYEARSKLYQEMGKLDLAEKDKQEAIRQKSKPAEKPVYDLR